MRFLLLLTLVSIWGYSKSQSFIPYKLDVPGTARGIKMIPLVGGSFTMGSPDTEPGRKPDEGPLHEVNVSDFWMADMEITWEQYEAFVFQKKTEIVYSDSRKLKELGIDGLSGATTPYVEMSFGMGKEGYPAVNMTQYAALMFCKWLSAITGDFYRLPTEAEWEYACKSGSESIFAFPENTSDIEKYAVLKKTKYEKVGTRLPNEFGLYDMSGNVAEWTMDKYDPDFYTRSKMDNPWLPPDELYPRVVRGGSWDQQPEEARCSSRMSSRAKWKERDPQLPKSRWWHTNAPFVGFRIVRPKTQPDRKEIQKFWLEAMEDYGQ